MPEPNPVYICNETGESHKNPWGSHEDSVLVADPSGEMYSPADAFHRTFEGPEEDAAWEDAGSPRSQFKYPADALVLPQGPDIVAPPLTPSKPARPIRGQPFSATPPPPFGSPTSVFADLDLETGLWKPPFRSILDVEKHRRRAPTSKRLRSHSVDEMIEAFTRSPPAIHTPQ